MEKRFLGSRVGKQELGQTDRVALDSILISEIKEVGLSEKSQGTAVFLDSSWSLRK